MIPGLPEGFCAGLEGGFYFLTIGFVCNEMGPAASGSEDDCGDKDGRRPQEDIFHEHVRYFRASYEFYP